MMMMMMMMMKGGQEGISLSCITTTKKYGISLEALDHDICLR